MKMYDDLTSPRICGDCRDMMMRSPICAERTCEPSCTDEGARDFSCDLCNEDGCGVADEYSQSPLAIVSSPYQGFGDVFDCPTEALKNGTLFRTLCFPVLDANGTRGKGVCNG